MTDANIPMTCPAHAPSDHPKLPTPKVGILLSNLGTPDNTDYWSMRRYLGRISVGSPRHRLLTLALAAVVAAYHPDETPFHIWRGLPLYLERRSG